MRNCTVLVRKAIESEGFQFLLNLRRMAKLSVGLGEGRGGGGSIAQWLAYLFPDPAAPGLIPNIPEIFSEEKW